MNQDEHDDLSEHARALSVIGAQKGGKARAANLTKEQRQGIARQAALVRWGNEQQQMREGVLRAICGSPDRPLKINDIEIQCYVLEDETRVLSQRGLQQGIGMSTSGGNYPGAQRLARLIQRFGTKVPELNTLSARIQNPIEFQPTWGGRTAFGYEATILADICDAVLAARKAGGLLHKNQEHIADQCEILMRGFARVGIIALVDEATGYQELRAKTALEHILKRFISQELQRWVKTFPDEFYYELFKLRHWDATDITKRPGVAGRITIDIVYKRLAPQVLEELQKRTPRDEKGRLKSRLFQHLTPEYGHPKLREHLWAVITLMRASNGSWSRFYDMLNRALPQYDTTLPLPLDYEDGKDSLSALPDTLQLASPK
jgi:hypothetical protein